MSVLSSYFHRLTTTFVVLFVVLPLMATASTAFKIPSEEEAKRVNENTVGVVFTHEELFHQAVHNMEDELEPYDGLRIVPIMGKNHVQSLYDLLYLKGVDLALVRADALEYLKRQEGNDVIGKVIRNITSISTEKISIFARTDIKTMDDLNGKRVALGLAGSGAYVTGTVVFDLLGVEADLVELGSLEAAQQLRSGELDAMVYLLRESDAVMAAADAESSKRVRNLKTVDGLHILPMPENAQLSTVYTSTTLTAEDLPGVIAADDAVDTYSVDAILAAYKWRADNPRQARVDRFVSALVNSMDGLKTGPYQPLWSRVSFDTETPGVERLDLVDNALAEREIAAAAARQKSFAAREARIEERRAAKVAELEQQKESINQRLREQLSNADSEELVSILKRVDTFLSELDKDGEQIDGETTDN